MNDADRHAEAPSPIRRFRIIRLFGDRDIDIHFSSPFTILVAANGSGKTTVLSIIYAVLSGRLHRLRKHQFDRIVVDFSTGESVSIDYKSIRSQLGSGARVTSSIRRRLAQISEPEIQELVDETQGMPWRSIRTHPLAERIADRVGVPPSYILRYIHESMDSPQLALNLSSEGQAAKERELDEIRSSLMSKFPHKSLYFPTYRRIEEELEELGYVRKEGSGAEGLIRFGMDDVTQRIKFITEKIEKSSFEWYSRISGQMLSQLVDGITVNDSDRQSIQDKSALKIVLDRVGTSISSERKLRIMGLVDSGEIVDQKHEILAYFLSNLIKVYDQQREYDAAMKDFTRVCNKYLRDKEVVYDESLVDLRVVHKLSRKPVRMAQLSSGEKQIVSLFSRIYLEDNHQLAMLFDEPELSLSIEWQRMLLPDIVSSRRCAFLVATTHSPFIFENELDGNAREMSTFVRIDEQ